MIANPYSGQFEQQVLCASPVELVGIIFDHLLAAIADSRRALLEGDRTARARSVAKAVGLLGELSRSLDMERGAELALNLRRIYAFAGDCLTQAHTQEMEQPLLDALEALRPLRDAWRQLDQSAREDSTSLCAVAPASSEPSPVPRFALSA
jgi:flagellar protein FliS